MRREAMIWLVIALSVGLLTGCAVGVTPPEATDPAGPSAGDTRTRRADSMLMVFVPGGEFAMGSTVQEAEEGQQLCLQYHAYETECLPKHYEGELPQNAVAVSAYWIDRTEVTNAQYARCVAAGTCTPPAWSGSDSRPAYYGDPAYDRYPVITVTWFQADSYCQWAEARLPTEAQWEYAAHGPEGLRYPWGNEFDGTRLNYCDASCTSEWHDLGFDDGYPDTAPVGSDPGGASWCGALDLAGNVFEWVEDWYGPYSGDRQTNPTGPESGDARVFRGGAWSSSPDGIRTTYRHRSSPDNIGNGYGFRCAVPDPGAGR